MDRTLLHVFRNNPLGRETLLQSAHFAKAMGLVLQVYIPKFPQFLLYFEPAVVTVTLDGSYLEQPELAEQRMRDIVEPIGAELDLYEPHEFTAPTLPDVPSHHAFMACPRSMSEPSRRVHFGTLGPRVRSIVQNATFPALLPTSIYKPWTRVTCCYGGSRNASRALAVARGIHERAGGPLRLLTFAEGKKRAHYEQALERDGVLSAIESGDIEWRLSEDRNPAIDYYSIDRDTLVVLGAYGARGIKRSLFGGTLERIQAAVPNNLIVVGPNA